MASRIGLKLSLRRNSRQKTDDGLQAERTSQDQRFAKTDQDPATQEVARVDATKRKEKAVILVMGPTGVGKSTFINLASNSDLRVSNSLVSCTDRIEVSNPFELDGKDVVLVDTPGFDDTSKSEADILNVVCGYLASEYKHDHLLHGILYLYRISDNRVSGVAARNLRFYRDLCGPEALPNSIIVTNFWGNVDPAEGVAREQELTTKPAFFKPALDAGARVWRHDGTVASAHRILRQLVHAAPRALQVQRELVDERRAVHATAAGETLLEDLARAAQKHAQEMAQLEEDLADAQREQDEEAQRELEEERARIAEEQAKLAGEREKLMHLQVEALTRASSPVSGVQMQNFPATFAQAMSAQLASAPQATTMTTSPPATPPSAAAEQAQQRAQAQAEQAQAKAAAERAQAQAQADAQARAKVQAEAQAKAKADAERARAEAEAKAKEQAAREQEAREQAAREQAARVQEAREKATREQAAREQIAREQVEPEGRANAPTHTAAQAPPPAPSAPSTPAPPPAAPTSASAPAPAPAPEPPKPTDYDAEHGVPQEVGPSAGCFGALARLFSAILRRLDARTLDALWARLAGLFLHPFYALLGYTRLE